MGLLRRVANPSEARLTLSQAITVLARSGMTNIAPTGVAVNMRTATMTMAVMACVRVLAEDIAGLPLPVYRRLRPRGKQRAPEHPAYPLLHDEPNPHQTSFVWRETLMAHAALWGNCYSEIQRDENGDLVALWPLTPWRVRPFLNPAKQVMYEVQTNDLGVGPPGYIFPARQILHTPWLSFDGLIGATPLSLARDAIGLAKAMEEFGSRFFGNGAWPGIVFTHPKRLSTPAYNRLKRETSSKHQGIERAHRTMILEEGMKPEKVGIPPEDAQFLQSRQFSKEEIASFYRMQLHKIQSLKDATFSNIEHQGIEHVVDTLRPWTVRFEQEYNRKLFLGPERAEFFVEHLIDGLLRGDSATRWKTYTMGVQWGVYSANDVLEMENRNPIGPEGDRHYMPLNMMPVEDIGNGNDGGGGGAGRALVLWEQRSIAARRRIASSFRRLFEETAARIIRREEADIMRAARRLLPVGPAEEFERFVAEFFQEHEDYVRRQLFPLYESLAEGVDGEAKDEFLERSEPRYIDVDPDLVFVRNYTDSAVNRWVGKSRGEILSVVGNARREAKDPVRELGVRFTEWAYKRPERFARWETVKAAHATYLESGRRRGFRRKRWVTHGDNCPWCQMLAGRTVGIDEIYLEKGHFLEHEEGGPMKASADIGHPPIHEGCDCSIVVES